MLERTRRFDVLALTAVLAVIWEILPHTGLIPRLFLAPLSEVLLAGWSNRSAYLDALTITAAEVASALTITLACGIPIGFAIGSIKALHSLLAIASAAYAIPMIAIYPLLCAWFGFGSQPRILLGVFLGIIPVILIVGEAARLVDAKLLLLSRALGASRWQALSKIYVPAVIPALVSAIRVGSGLVIIGVIVGQMLLSSAGLGYLITYYRTAVDPAALYFAVLMIIAIVLVVDAAISLLLRLPIFAASDAEPLRSGEAARSESTTLGPSRA